MVHTALFVVNGNPTMPGWWNQDDASRPARRMGEVPPDHDYLPHFRSIRQVRLGSIGSVVTIGLTNRRDQ